MAFSLYDLVKRYVIPKVGIGAVKQAKMGLVPERYYSLLLYFKYQYLYIVRHKQLGKNINYFSTPLLLFFIKSPLPYQAKLI